MNTRVIFVHGLGGKKSTWGQFPRLIEEDATLDVSIDFMNYPSPLLGLKFSYLFQDKYQSIEDLAKSLRTFIEIKHADAHEIVLVGHSMGGLIVRKYLLEEMIAGRQHKVGKVILYAVPNRGAGLATLFNGFSLFENPHLYQLCEHADFIKLLNESWAKSKIEASVDVTVVVAGNDKLVTVDSAEGIFLHLEPHQIPGVGHSSIVKPAFSSDLSFMILKSTILKKKYLPELQLPGACNFTGWQKYPKFSKFDFCVDEKRQAIFDELMNEFNQTGSTLRLKGLSGLGKTRLVYEAVLASSRETRDKVLYIDVASGNFGIKSWLKQAIDLGYQGILVVDNCKPELHKELSDEVGREDSKVVFISLDHNLDSLPASNTKEYKIEPLDRTQIRALLEPEYGDRITDLDRVAGYAQGFPQMAVLIAEARLTNHSQVGKLRDDELTRKLLGHISEQELSILKGCSLFDTFGFTGEVADQYEYIANNAVKVSPSEFYTCIKKFQNRGLIDVSGRYAQLVPKPLAISLAADWWDRTRKEDQLSFLEQIPDTLVKPFCLQVTMLGFIPEVQELTRTLCGPQGPFGQAEAILSYRGSLLLRSFVEVNPVATSSALHAVLITLNNRQLANISGDVRRNLVWALEKLAFHAHVFEEAAWSLMLLASAENERWSNNATGIFIQLFRVNLSGTEADFELRLRLIRRAIDLNDINIDKVIIKALNASISTHTAGRAIGAEYQGTKEPLKEWRATQWQEIFDYWNTAFEMLVKFTEYGNENSQEAQNILGRSIRGLVRNGRLEMIDRAIKCIVELNGRYWPTALESIKTTLMHDTQKMPQEGIAALNNWLQLLSPTKENLAERLKIIVVNPPWEYGEDERGDYIDVAAQNAEQLAVELSEDIQALTEHIPLLISGEQKQTFAFGRRLAFESKDSVEFLQSVMSELGHMESPNEILARGLLSGLHVNSNADWNRFLEEFSSRKQLMKFYPDMLRTGEMQSYHLSKLLDLIRQGELHSYYASVLSYGSATSHLSSKDISTFCLELAEIDAKGSWAALNIMFMHCFNDDNRFDENRASLRKLIIMAPLNSQFINGHLDIYHWIEVTKKLLVTEGLPFCEDICRQLVVSLNNELDHGENWNAIRPLLTDIVKTHGKNIWPIFGEAIISAKPIQRYRLQLLLERDNNLSNIQPSIFSILPLDLVIEWCRRDMNVAPFFVARAINIFEQDADGMKQPTTLFIAMLENFGELAGFGGELSANLGTGGWWGSLVPYLESDKAALVPLSQHPHKNVRAWVREYIAYLDRSIAYESVRDDEDRLDIH